MSEQENQDKSQSPSLARRLFRTVGQVGTAAGKVVGSAGSAVGDAAGFLVRSAGQSAKTVGGRASLTFSGDVEEAPEQTVRELAESLTRWLVEEHGGTTDLQKQKPSTIELTEDTSTSESFVVNLEEPGLMGRRLRFIFRETVLSHFEDNLPVTDESFHSQVLIALRWPHHLNTEPEDLVCLLWDHATAIGERNAARDVAQSWIKSELGGTFCQRRVFNDKAKLSKVTPTVPIYARDQEMEKAERLLVTPIERGQTAGILSLSAPGGTGKSYFLKALRSVVQARTCWAAVDHQGLTEGESEAGVVARLLADLAKQLEEQSLTMDDFSKEFRAYKQRTESESGEPTGLLRHLRKAAETAAGINPVLGAASAGVMFFTSWGQELKEVSEAIAKDDDIKALTDAFRNDLLENTAYERERFLMWRRPVLVFDTYEWLAPLIDTWLRTILVADDFFEKTGAMVILAGREHLLRTDTRWSEHQHAISSVSLEPFDEETSSEYLRTLGCEESRLKALFELTEGSPLFLSLVAQIQDDDEAIAILSQRILEEVKTEYRPHFLRAALLSSFDKTSIASLFDDLDDSAQTELLDRLKKATFTIARDGKRGFIPSVQKILSRTHLLEVGDGEHERFRAVVTSDE